MQKNLGLGRLGGLSCLISPVALANRRSSRCLLGLQNKLSLRRTQDTRGAYRLCLTPSTLVALLRITLRYRKTDRSAETPISYGPRAVLLQLAW